MNKKAGLYTGAIALAAMALIVTILFNSISDARVQETRSQAEAILDLKWEMQNSQYLAGKSIADALADAAYNSGACIYDGTLAKEKITSYLGSPEITEAFQGCEVSIDSINAANPLNISVEVNFPCKKDSGSLQAYYGKMVEFRKSVVIGAGCNIRVTDLDTGQEEVNKA